MISIAPELLKKIVGEDLVYEMTGCLEMFSINTILRAAHFLSQCQHESGGFKHTEENLNYSAIGLMNTWPKHFPDRATANAYARDPIRIANRVYAGRNGNGDETSGDGWKFRGRGYIQTTGRANYEAFSKFVREDILMTTPDLLILKKYACLSAGFFWHTNKLNDLADTGSDDAVVQAITKKVNGGLTGIAERTKYFRQNLILLQP